jgi:hypothetical protein
MKLFIFFLQSLIMAYFEKAVSSEKITTTHIYNGIYYIRFITNVETSCTKSFYLTVSYENDVKAVITYDNDGLNLQLFPCLFRDLTGKILHAQLKSCVDFCINRNNFFTLIHS